MPRARWVLRTRRQWPAIRRHQRLPRRRPATRPNVPADPPHPSSISSPHGHQAATPANDTATPAVVVSASAPTDFKTMRQLLQDMQATNTATLKKQEAALETLDVLEKAAEEIKIYSKRG